MTRQQQILKEIAKRHGVPEYQVEEVWKQFTNALASELSKVRKNSEGKFVEEDFPIIHVDNFGKFIPRINFIRRLNKHKKDKSNEQS